MIKTKLISLLIPYMFFVNLSCKNNSYKNEEFLSTTSDLLKQKDIIEYTKDTTLNSGWQVKYLLKNNNKLNADLYIKIQKENFNNISLYPGVMSTRRYFIPQFLDETKKEILFEHACATDCRAILSISKENKNITNQYFNVVDYNKERQTLIYITDNSYKYEDKLFEIGIINFQTDKKDLITLNKITSAIIKPSVIDSIIYSQDSITIITNLRENLEVIESTKETHIIKI